MTAQRIPSALPEGTPNTLEATRSATPVAPIITPGTKVASCWPVHSSIRTLSGRRALIARITSFRLSIDMPEPLQVSWVWKPLTRMSARSGLACTPAMAYQDTDFAPQSRSRLTPPADIASFCVRPYNSGQAPASVSKNSPAIKAMTPKSQFSSRPRMRKPSASATWKNCSATIHQRPSLTSSSEFARFAGISCASVSLSASCRCSLVFVRRSRSHALPARCFRLPTPSLWLSDISEV